MSKSKKTSETPVPDLAGFERSLQDLEALVERMESGELGLDESLRDYERGIALYRQCHDALAQAELRVQRLRDPKDPDSLTTLDDDAI